MTAPSRKSLILMVLGALAAAALFVLVILPAQFHSDPTGFGAWSGLTRLAGVEEVKVAPVAPAGGAAARFYDIPYRSDVIDIPLVSPDLGQGVSELETKVRMKTGSTLIYSFTVTGLKNPEEFYYDVHGHTLPDPANPGGRITVTSYRDRTGLADNGSLIAPFDGIHGWYFQNQSAGPIVVHLKFSGFYTLVSPEELKVLSEAASAQAMADRLGKKP